MADLTDLELVAQAMSPTEPQNLSSSSKPSKPTAKGTATAAKEKSNSLPSSRTSTNGTTPQSTTLKPAQTVESPDTSLLQLAGIDPSILQNLSVQDREALQPIISALQQANRIQPDINGHLESLDVADEEEGDDADGEEGEEDIEDILRQMNAADLVANELEGKLDGLIASLRDEEKGLEGEVEKGAESAILDPDLIPKEKKG